MTITVKITEETKKAMDEFYKDLVRPKTPQYALFQADDGDTVVTLYESGKAVFQGKDADLAIFDGNPMEVFTNTLMTIIDGEIVYTHESVPDAHSGEIILPIRFTCG